MDKRVTLPCVSVICIAYNHSNFVEEAIESLLRQTYPCLEITIVDNGSKDDTLQKIKKCCINTNISILSLEENMGNCKAFNRVLQRAKGKYIVDFSADDILLPDSILEKVLAFEKLDGSFGVVYSNAVLIDSQGREKRNYYRHNFVAPTKNLYTQLLYRTCICAPTMLLKTSMLHKIGGYDETLSFEDFDLWVRTAKKYGYFYLNKITVKKRVHKKGLSQHFYEKNNKHIPSVLKVCKKVMLQNETRAEEIALSHCIKYHMRLALFSSHFKLLPDFYHLLKKLNRATFLDKLFLLLSKTNISFHFLYGFYRNFVVRKIK